jgi:hypothetical protein
MSFVIDDRVVVVRVSVFRNRSVSNPVRDAVLNQKSV